MSGASDDCSSAAHSFDHGGLDALFRRESPRLLRYFRRKTGDTDTALDLVQDSFVSFARLSSLAHIRNPAAYLQRVARNLLYSRARARRQTPDSHDLALGENCDIEVAPSQEDAIEARDLLRLYECAIAGLAPKTRDIFLMSRRDGMTYRLIGAEIGLSLKGVEYHMSRAIAHIDRYMDLHS